MYIEIDRYVNMYFSNVEKSKSTQWVERLYLYKVWVIEYSNG